MFEKAWRVAKAAGVSPALALTVLATGMSMTMGMHSAWATGTTITIDGNEATTPTTYSQTKNVGIDGKGSSGTKTDISAGEVEKIQTTGSISAEVFGIKYEVTGTLTVGSLYGGIAVTSNSNDANGIKANGGTTTVMGLGGITATGSTKANGIFGTVANTELGVTFVSGGTINATTTGESTSQNTKAANGIIASSGENSTTTVTGLGGITVNGSKTANGINGNNYESFEVTFSGAGSYIDATSTSADANGILAGTNNLATAVTVTNLGGITVSGGTAAYGIKSNGGTATLTNNVTFVSGGTINATSTSGSAYGISAQGTSTTTVTGLGGITASGSTAAYGIYSDGTNADNFKNNVSFKGTDGQAITATATDPANAYSIYVEGQGSTTVNFENSILSGKIKKGEDTSTLTLNFNSGGVWTPKVDDVTGNFTVNLKSGSELDTRAETTAVKGVLLSSVTINAESGSKVSFDAEATASDMLSMDTINVGYSSSGTIALGSINVHDMATADWTTAKTSDFKLFSGGSITLTGTTTTTTTGGRKYTFTAITEGADMGKISATSATPVPYTLPQIIKADPQEAGESDTYSMTADETMTAALGTLNNQYRSGSPKEFTLNGNSKTLTAASDPSNGVTINSGDTMTVKNVNLSGFDTFATNGGTLNLSGVTFTGTTGTADVVNNGTLNLTGTNTFAEGISGTGTTNVNADTNMGNATLTQGTTNVAENVTLTMGADLTATSSIAIGNGGTLSIAAGNLKGAVNNSGTVALGAGTLGDYTISGSGKITLTGNVSANASNLAATGGIVNNSANQTLTLTGGTLGTKITGSGKTVISGAMTASDYNYAQTMELDTGAILNLQGTSKFTTDANITGSGTINVADNGVLDTRAETTAAKTIDFGSNALTFGTGATINFDANLSQTTAVTDKIKAASVTGTLTLGTVNITTVDTGWDLGDTRTATLVEATNTTGFSITGTTTATSEGYKYEFKSASTVGKLDITKGYAGTLADIIQNKTVEGYNMGNIATYSLLNNYTATAALGALMRVVTGTPREFTISGNSKTLTAASVENNGVNIINTGDTMTVQNVTLSGFDTFATNAGTLNLNNVTFTGTTGTDVVNNGTLNLSGTNTFINGITGIGTTNVNVDTDMGDATLKQSSTTVANGVTLIVAADKLQSAVTNNGTVELGEGKLTSNITNNGTLNLNGTTKLSAAVTGSGTINVADNGILDTRAETTATKAINLGSNTLTLGTDSQLKIDVAVNGDSISLDSFTVGSATGTVTLADVAFTGTATDWAADTSVILITGKCSNVTFDTVEFDYGDYSYEFKQSTADNDGLTLTITQTAGLPGVIVKADGKDTYTLGADETLKKDLGTLNSKEGTGTKRTSLTIDGAGHTLNANGKAGVTIGNGDNDVLNVKNLTISGFDTFATNGGTLNLENVKFTGTTGDVDVVNTGVATVGGTVTLDKGIDNEGTLNLENVTFTGTTGDADVVNYTAGVVNIGGTVTLYKGIYNEGKVIVGEGNVLKGEVRGTGTLDIQGNAEIDTPVVNNNIVVNENKEISIKGETTMGETATITGYEGGKFIVTEGSKLEYKNTDEKSIKAKDNETFEVIVEKGATLDPVVSVFAEGVNVTVKAADGTTDGGTLILSPGTLYANIIQEAGSTLEVKASDLAGTTFLTGVDQASQLEVKEGTLVIDGAKEWGYYDLVSGVAVTDGSLTPDELWKVKETLSGQGFESEYDIQDGKITLEYRNIPLAVEGNTSALAGVQQGAITMANQIADSIGDNVGLLARPSLADAVYEKTIWANYINSKETVDGMAMWRGSGDNTAKYHGVTVGADFYTSKKAIAGVALTYVTGDVNNYADSTVTNNKTKYYGISLYDRVTNGKSAWTYDLGYSQGKNEITQNSYQTITADAKTNAYTIGAKYEYACNFKHSSLVPFASLRYLRLNSNDYSNSNGHNMSINNQKLIIPKLGLAWTGDFAMPKSDWKFKPVVEVGYIWNLKGREADGTFTSRNRAYDIAYDTVDKSSYYTKLGLNFNRKNFDVGVFYHYSKGDSVRNNKWNVNLNWKF